MTITLNALQKQRRDTASNWTSNNPTLLDGELGYETDTKKFKIGDGSTAWQSLDYLPIPDTNRLLAGNLTVGGNFTVNGTSTTIDTTTLTVEDKNIEIGKVSSPSDTTADGGGITLKAASDKTITWSNANDSWDFNQNINAASTYAYKINNVSVLNATTLGSSVVNSSLTSVGTIATGVWNATAIARSKLANVDLVDDTSPQLGGLLDANGSNIKFADSSGATINRAVFGTGDDLQIYHAGDHSYISDTGTGQLRIRSNDLRIQDTSGNAGIQMLEGGAVYLYHSGSQKFETTSNGATITPDLILNNASGDTALRWADGGTNKFSLYQSSGTLRFYDNTNSAERMRIDSSGRVGIGVSPSDFHSNNTAVLQLKDGNSIFSRTGGQFLGFFQNIKYNSSDVSQYVANGLGSAYFQAAGEHKFYSVASGTANNNATLSESLRINSDGDVLIGRTSTIDTSEILGLKGPSGDSCTIGLTSDGTTQAGIIAFNDDDATFRGRIQYSHNDDSMAFHTAGSQRMLLDSSGRVGINYTPASGDGIFNVKVDDSNVLHIGHGSNKDNYFTCGSSGMQVFRTAGTERLRIDSSGRLLLGTTNKGLAAGDDLTIATSGETGITLRSGQSNNGAIYFSDGTSGADEYRGIINYNHTNNFLTFYTDASERMRIDSSGHLLVSRTASIHGGKLSLDYTNGTTAGMAIKDTQTSGTGVPLQVVNGSGTIVGSITMNQSNTAFNISSDYRLKENVVAISDGITRLKTLKPSRFNWISDLSNTTIDGFLAHEVTAVPEAVQGEKDAVATEDNEKGKKGDPIYQQIDLSKLVPLLTAALQEAITKIETLETKVAALEAA